MKVLLTTITPPDDYFPIQLALYYLKAYVKKYGNYRPSELSIDIEIFPPHAETPSIAKDIIDKHPDIVGFSGYIWNIQKILKTASILKKYNPKIKIILGGPEVSPRPGEVLKQERPIDIVVRGEGEETFLELIKSFIHQQTELSAIKGISYRNQRQEIFTNPDRPLIDDLNLIPSPYLEGLIDLKKVTMAPTETMRGCYYRCNYCYYHKEFNKLRFFSLDRIEAELKYILGKEAADVYLMDPTFNTASRRAKDILRIFIKYNKRSRLHVELRIELLDEEMAELLRQAKANFIEIGIQSINSKVLRLVNRTALKRNVLEKNLKLLNKKNLFFQVHLIDGLPAHTYSDIKKSLDWLFKFHPAQVLIMKLMLLPGTYLRQNAQRLGIKYYPNPPYYFYKSATLSKYDLKRIEKLRYAMSLLYDCGLLRNGMYLLKDKLKINFSDIFEEWINWINKPLRYTKRSLPKQTPRFVKYLCNKYKDYALYNIIYPTIKNDLINFYINVYKDKKPNYQNLKKRRNGYSSRMGYFRIKELL